MNSKTKPFDAKKGDVVLIHEDNVKRSKWNVGLIDDFVIGRDGVIRGAAVRKIGGDGRPQIVHRPLQKLYPLEITSSTHDTNDTAGGGVETAVDDVRDGDSSTRDVVCDVLPNRDASVEKRDDSPPVDIRRTTRTMRSTRTAAVEGEIRRRLNQE
jgi:hypothetical protein